MNTVTRLIFVIAVIALLAVPASGAVLAQSVNPDDSVIQVQIPEKEGLPWYVGAILFLAVAVGLTIYKNRHQEAKKNRSK